MHGKLQKIPFSEHEVMLQTNLRILVTNLLQTLGPNIRMLGPSPERSGLDEQRCWLAFGAGTSYSFILLGSARTC